MNSNITSCKFCAPSGTLFSTGHTWIRKNEYGLFKIGIDEVTLKILENISLGSIARLDTFINKDDFIFEIKSGGMNIPVKAPVAGRLKFVNPFLTEKNVIDVYEDDWIILFQAKCFAEDKCKLMTNEEYKNWILYELDTFGESFMKNFISGDVPELKYN